MMLPPLIAEPHPMPAVNLGRLITAFTDPPRASRAAPAFIHRTTGEVLFVAVVDAVTAKWFPCLPLGKLLAALQSDPSWLGIPMFSGRLTELGASVREWCAANGFTLE
jgi:hypothetical protein